MQTRAPPPVLSWVAAGRVATDAPPVGGTVAGGVSGSDGHAGAVTPSPPPRSHRPGTPPGLLEPVIAHNLSEVLSGRAPHHGTGRIHRDIQSDNTLVTPTPPY